MALTDSFFYDSVYVVESLSGRDPKTGTDLADFLTYELPNKIPVVLRRPQDRASFLAALEDVAAAASGLNRSPILHLETHGSPDGVELASGEIVHWRELRPKLTEINVASRLNLLVFVAACHGHSLIQTISPFQRAPVWGIIGPVAERSPGELYRDAKAFYRELLTSS